MSDDDSSSETETENIYKPSFVLIAIDTSPSMFIKKENSESTPFKDCLIACYELADSLMFVQNTRSWNPFAVALASDDNSASLINFKDNVINSIKLLKEKSDQSEEELLNYQRKTNCDLSAFFLFCMKKFKEIKSAFNKKTIIYITNDDDPIKNDQNQRFAALNEAKNFEANDIEFQMVTMNPHFDYTLFYNELFSVIKTPLVETLIEDKEGLLEKLSSLTVIKFYQRKLKFYPFQDDQERFINVIQKKFIQKQKLYNNAYVNDEGKVVKKCYRTSETLKTFSVRTKSGKPLSFDFQEYNDVKTNEFPVGYTLIYVSNRVTQIGQILSNSAILEVDYTEDLPYFDSFWQYCVDKDKVLICLRKLKKLDKIRFVEFIPKFANNTRLFLIKTIPFINEQKNPPTRLQVDKELDEEVSEEKMKLTNQLIDSLTFDYHPKMFTNPVYAKKKAFLKSKFLEEELEEVEDLTLDNEAIDSRLGEVAQEFKDMFNLDEEVGKKRRGKAQTGTSKRRK